MNFIAWLISLPTTLMLIFFPVPQEAIKPAEIASTTPLIETVAVSAFVMPTVKERVIKALQSENIEIHEIPVTIPSNPSPAPTEAPQDVIITPMPESEAPAPEAPIVAHIFVTDRKLRPLYSGCSIAPVAQFIVSVQDKDGNEMNGQKVKYVSTENSIPEGEFDSGSSEGRFSIAIKNVESGKVGFTFSVGTVATSTEVEVLPAPTDSANRPNWCD